MQDNYFDLPITLLIIKNFSCSTDLSMHHSFHSMSCQAVGVLDSSISPTSFDDYIYCR